MAFAIACAALFALRSSSALHPPYPKRDAVRAALRDAGVKGFLAGNGWSRATVIALDRDAWRVTFWSGPRVVLDAEVGARGQVEALEEHSAALHPAGANTLWTPAALVLLGALFAFAVAAGPLRSRRNLDAAVVAAGFTASVLLHDARLIAAHVYVGIATLAWVAFRCARVGLAGSEAAGAGEPLYARALARVDAERLIAMVCGALIVAGVVLTVTSTNPSDVDVANLAGATLLNHGVLPYGHLPGFVVHGDTYPLLSYVLFMPSAAIAPVRDAFDSFDGGLWLNALALALAAWGLARASGRTHALAWLAFPPVLLAASGGSNDVPAACIVVGAVLLFDRAVASSSLLALAGWVKLVPAAALLVWIPRLGRAEGRRALAVAVAIVVAGLLAILAVGGTAGLSDGVDALRFQLVRGSWYSVWQQLGARWLQVLFQAATIGFAAALVVVARQATPGAFGLRRSAALAGALIALLQIGANYWTYAYLPWLLPFILVALFPPAPPRSPPPAPPAP